MDIESNNGDDYYAKEVNEQINGIINLIAICFLGDTGIVLIIRKLSPSTLI